ncbi:MAG: flagellar motor switch protein FliM [Burkholderiales bacterium]|nr:flagellar motor switch protein FliM [Burkholderiales bacterium]
MAKEFLSQDEVDALLQGVTGEGEEEPAPGAGPGIPGPRPYNLARQERIVRGRMPTLEAVNERFARRLRTGLFNFMRRAAEVSVSPARTQNYGDLVTGLPAPASFNVVHARPLRGAGLVVFEAALVLQVIDALFGGDGRFAARAEAREFTPTESRIIERLLEVVFEGLEHAWEPVHPLKFERVRSETNPRFVALAPPGELMVAAGFTIDLGAEAAGAIHVALPYAMLEPIRETLFAQPRGEKAEPDKRWLRLLSKQVQSAEVQLAATLAHATLPLEQVLKLKAGDVIGMEIGKTVTAEVDGVPVMECRYGACNGQYALQVVRVLHHGNAEDTARASAA